MLLNFSGYDIPDHTQESFESYIIYGLPPGSFMLAVLSNDLLGAVSHADTWNKQRIVEIVQWMAARAPIACWGSHEKVATWLKDEDGTCKEYRDRLEKNKMWAVLQS